MSLLDNFILLGPPLVVAVVLHEVAHGYVAEKLGDPTARAMGRITLNPIRHIDPVMTILLPSILIMSGSPVVFGGAKPVPVNPGYFRNPRRGMAIVAIAGPVTNFLLAAACWATFAALGQIPVQYLLLPKAAVVVIAHWLVNSVVINLVLGTFNLIPVPPLDGGRILVGFLPLGLARSVAKLERYGLLLVFLILYSGIFQQVLGPLVDWVLRQILRFG